MILNKLSTIEGAAGLNFAISEIENKMLSSRSPVPEDSFEIQTDFDTLILTDSFNNFNITKKSNHKRRESVAFFRDLDNVDTLDNETPTDLFDEILKDDTLSFFDEKIEPSSISPLHSKETTEFFIEPKEHPSITTPTKPETTKTILKDSFTLIQGRMFVNK